MKSLLLLLVMFSGIAALGQSKKAKHKHNSSDTLQITFRDGRISKTSDFTVLRTREVLKIIVENVNPFLFDITTKQYQNDYLNELKNEQALLLNYNLGSLKFEFPETSNMSLSTVQLDDRNFTKSVSDKIIKLDSLKTLQNKINKVYDEEINPRKNNLTDSNLTEQQKNELIEKINQHDIDLAKVINKRDILKEELDSLSNQNQDDEADKKMAYVYQKLFNSQLEAYNKKINELQSFFNFFQALKLLVYSSGKSFEDMAMEKQILANRYLNKATSMDNLNGMDLVFQMHTLLDNISLEKSNLDNTFNEFILKKKNNDFEKELTLNMSAILKDLNEQKKKINITSLDEIIANTVLLYNAIDKETFTYNFLINNVKEKADYISFEFNATSKNAMPYVIKPKPVYYTLTVPLKNGVQMNVSSGFFFNIGIFNKEYKYQATDSTQSLFKVVPTSNKLREHFSPSIGLMLHIYERSNSATKVAGAIGFSTSNATDLRYYVGGSLIFGKTQRFVLSSGVVGGQRQILKSSFGESRFDDKDDNITVSKEFKDNNLSIPTQPKFRLGWFISLTLNLWGKSPKEFDFENIQKTKSN